MVIKIGAPINAVRMPIGISDGGAIVRLIVSADNSNILPNTADKGNMIW